MARHLSHVTVQSREVYMLTTIEPFIVTDLYWRKEGRSWVQEARTIPSTIIMYNMTMGA